MKLPQFTLRELFLLVVIAAMGCGWWVERQLIDRERDTLRENNARLSKGYLEVLAGWRACAEAGD